MTRDLDWHENKKLRRMEVAAPEMLAALQAILAAKETGFPEALQLARAAIAKATGGEA
jgi:uncharacterized membrane protein